MKYFIKTLGCAMNISDSERLASFLEDRGFALAEKEDPADIIIFNTCGIRQAAENRVYSFINNIRKTNKVSKIIVTGCLSHREDVQKRLRDKVNLFFSIKDFSEFENWIIKNCLEIGPEDKLEAKNWKLEIAAANETPDKESISYLSINPSHKSNYAAYVPIMTGCDNFCSYCVVPYARGREVSRPAEEIVAEIKDLVGNGYKQITLLGQNVNSYHGAWSMEHGAKKLTFSDLLKKIDRISGKFWVTFVSSHPKDMSDELIETIAKCKKVCEWIHLPVQAGDDEILRKMNRKYTQRHFLGRIAKIKSAFKKHKPTSLFSISSDIIVGFPGETKKQFAESAVVMQKAKFDMAYFGQFSPRPGTVAFQMKDNVSNEEKEKREFELNEILKKTALANNKKYIGKTLEVLIDHVKSATADHVAGKNIVYFGKTRTQKNVKILAKKKGLIGKFTRVLITKANVWNLEGEIK